MCHHPLYIRTQIIIFIVAILQLTHLVINRVNNSCSNVTKYTIGINYDNYKVDMLQNTPRFSYTL